MADKEYAEKLGHAWMLHRQGQNNDAIREFSTLLDTSTDDIDALYGLGLAQRGAGELEAAQATFERCLTQLNQALEEHPREDRYEMMIKMAAQRLAEMKGGASASQ